MKVVAFTPIKLNSVRLPSKNILPLKGIPMLNYAIRTVGQLGIPNYVFCSDQHVMDHIQTPVEFLQRPESLDGNDVIGLDIYKSFIEMVDADIYILYHVSSPLLKLKYFQEGLKAMEGGVSSSFTVREEKTFAWYDGVPLNYTVNHIPKTQDLQSVYLETSGFYMFRKDYFLEHETRIGPFPYHVVVDFPSSIDIDHLWEFQLCEALI